MYSKSLATLLLAAAAITGYAQKTMTITVTNPMKTARTAQPVVIPLADQGFDVRQAIVTRDGQEQPSQLDDLNGDGIFDELCFLTDLGKQERQTFSVTLSNTGEPRAYTPEVYVDMILTNKKIKSSNQQDLYISSLTVDKGTNPYWQLHHHGPAFENKLVGYRIYFDHRQTVDIYGKYHQGLELKDTQFYPDSAQKAAGYGDDVLWVGSTFGLGTLRGWDGQKPCMLDDVQHRTERIVSRGPLRTIVEVVDAGWTTSPVPSKGGGQGSSSSGRSGEVITMTTRYILYAGRRDCEVSVTFDRPIPQHQFATGIINVKNSVEMSDNEGLRGCWGTDWPVSAKDSVGHKRETVGLGICIPYMHIKEELPANKDNYPYVVGNIDRSLHYYITFGSDNEDFGYHSAEDWFRYLKAWKQELLQPVVVKRK